MKPDYIHIAISRPDGGVSVMMFITTEYKSEPLTPEQVEVSVQASIADWKMQKLKYDQRDIDSVRTQFESSHIQWTKEASDENIQSEIKKAGIDYVTYKIIDAPPQDRIFRDAWTLEGKEVTHDIDKCKSILIDRVRTERITVFEQIDKDFIAATQKEQDATDIKYQAQYLRDLPAIASEDMKNLKTIEEIKNYTIQWQKQK